MKHFIIGESGAGKSTLAAIIAAHERIPHLEGSGWVSDSYYARGEAMPDKHTPEGRAALDAYSQAQMRADPNIPLEWWRRSTSLTRPMVVSGLRDPRTFMTLYNPKEDRVISIRETTHTTSAPFDRGVQVIRDYLQWLKDNTIIEPWQYRPYVYDVHCEFQKTSCIEDSLERIAQEVLYDPR